MERRTTALVIAGVAVVMLAVGMVVNAVDDGGTAEAAAPSCIDSPPLVAFDDDGNGEGLSQVNLLQPDGTRQVVTPPDWVANGAAFTPDGSRLLVTVYDGDFESAGPSGSRIWSVAADGSDPRPVTGEDVSAAAPAVSSDGATVAHVADGSLALVPLVGGEPTVVVAAGDADRLRRPTWAPDGTRLAYVRGATGTTGDEVWTIGADGSDDRRVAEVPGAATLDWSPDGSRLLVSTDGGPGSGVGAGSVSTLDLESGTLRVVADGAVRARWSRGGTQVVMLTTDGGADYRLVERAVIGVDGADVSGGADRDLGVSIPFLYPYLDIAVAPCRA